MSDIEWQNQAACIGVDPELFFPPSNLEWEREAKRICRGCEVRVQCGQAAHENGEEFGIWGGESERERASAKRAFSITHGTSAGYRAHLRREQPACEPCKTQKCLDDRARERRNRNQEAS